MASPCNLADLEIIGYANTFAETMLPSVAPPVFRLKAEPGRAFLPPYSFSAGVLCNATEVSVSELEELRDSGEITLFDGVLPARIGFELWVDQAFECQYRPFDEARQELARIASEAIEQAAGALREGDLPRAERLAGIAISADDRKAEPLAIKAAIRRSLGNKLGERLMAELATPLLGSGLFDSLVSQYAASARRDGLSSLPGIPGSNRLPDTVAQPGQDSKERPDTARQG